MAPDDNNIISSSSASAKAAEAKPQCVSIMDAIKAVTNTKRRKFEEYLALNDSIVHLILHCDGKDFKKQEREKLQKVYIIHACTV